MGSLNYAFQFVKDFRIRITNLSSGTGKFSQDYYNKDEPTVNICYPEAKMIR